MFDYVDHLPGGVGVGDGAPVGHGPQVPEGGHQLLQRGVGNVGAVLLQHRQLRLGLRIVHRVAAKDVPCAEDESKSRLDRLIGHQRASQNVTVLCCGTWVSCTCVRTEGSKEVIAQEGETGSVGEDEHPEVGVHDYGVGPPLRLSGICAGDTDAVSAT